MFSEIVKLTPSVDKSSLNRMFATLNQRFGDLTKKFGAGIKNVMRFSAGGILSGALISKLLNPLQKAEEVIDRLLAKGDDAVTNAEEFGSDPGKLLRLEALGRAKGVDAETLRTLLGKFQGALAEEKENEIAGKPAGLLREFTDETDMAEGFFKFLQSMQALDPSRRTVVQSAIFGEKIRGRASELFNATDYDPVLAQLPSAEALGKAARVLAGLSDQKDLDTAKREAEDILVKAGLIKPKHVSQLDESARNTMLSENQQLLRFKSLKAASNEIDKLTKAFDKLATTLTNDLLPLVTKSIQGWNHLTSDVIPAIPNAVRNVGQGYTDMMTPYRQFEADSIDRLTTTLENIWGELKTSPLVKGTMRLFGGGK